MHRGRFRRVSARRRARSSQRRPIVQSVRFIQFIDSQIAEILRQEAAYVFPANRKQILTRARIQHFGFKVDDCAPETVTTVTRDP